MTDNNKTELASFAAGCFWDVEETFRNVDGVVETTVGFMGGDLENPSYRRVCGGDTGHAETTRITFDPNIVSYKELLDIFWNAHDPTQLNRQGPDIGEQYRSVIFYHNDTQKEAAEQSKKEHQDAFDNHIVTTIEPADDFYQAEEYHQKYIAKKRGEM